MARPNLETRLDNRDGIDRLQWPSGQFPHGIQFIFKDYDYGDFISKSPVGNLSGDGEGGGTRWTTANQRRATEKSAFVLELPFPNTLTDSTGVQISSFERGFIEEFLTGQAVAAADNPIQAAKDMGEAIANAAGGVASGKMFEGGDGSTGAMFKRLIGTLGTSVLGQLGLGEKSIGAALGSVQNPLTTLHFSGVDLRNFAFSWSVYPANSQEANDIKNIVNKVKTKILPGVQSLVPTGEGAEDLAAQTQGGLARAFLKYPSVVMINLLGVDESHYPKFKACMCKGIDINYADNGSSPTIAQGGVPMGISISMSFMELEIQTAEDYGAASGGSLDVAIPAVPEETTTTATAAAAPVANNAGG